MTGEKRSRAMSEQERQRLCADLHSIPLTTPRRSCHILGLDNAIENCNEKEKKEELKKLRSIMVTRARRFKLESQVSKFSRLTERSASRLQASFRGWLCRKNLRAMRMEVEEARTSVADAALDDDFLSYLHPALAKSSNSDDDLSSKMMICGLEVHQSMKLTS